MPIRVAPTTRRGDKDGEFAAEVTGYVVLDNVCNVPRRSALLTEEHINRTLRALAPKPSFRNNRPQTCPLVPLPILSAENSGFHISQLVSFSRRPDAELLIARGKISCLCHCSGQC